MAVYSQLAVLPATMEEHDPVAAFPQKTFFSPGINHFNIKI